LKAGASAVCVDLVDEVALRDGVVVMPELSTLPVA
jgi:hypothetical protein